MTNRSISDKIIVENIDSRGDSGEEWITVNGTPVRVENGELQGKVGEKIMESNNNSSQNENNISEQPASEATGTEEETPAGYSPTGANPDLTGFAARNLNMHFGSGSNSDHSDQYPNFTQKQYAERALALARSPVGGDIDGYVATRGKFKGTIVRYDASTNDWVRGGNGGIRTMFKPNDSNGYFERIKSYETGGN